MSSSGRELDGSIGNGDSNGNGGGRLDQHLLVVRQRHMDRMLTDAIGNIGCQWHDLRVGNVYYVVRYTGVLLRQRMIVIVRVVIVVPCFMTPCIMMQ